MRRASSERARPVRNTTVTGGSVIQREPANMDAFNYLSVLLSIIIGLGLTQVLAACGRLIRARMHVTWYWPALLWAAILIVIDVQVWWTMFGLRARKDWTFVAFFVVLLQTVTLYMMSAVLLPEQVDERGVDLRAHYHRQAPWFFGFLVTTLIVSVSKDVVLDHRLPGTVNLAFHAMLFAISLAGIFSRRDAVHRALALCGAASIGAYIALLFTRLH